MHAYAAFTQRLQHLKHVCGSKDELSNFLTVEATLDSNGRPNAWINEDLRPTPPEKQSTPPSRRVNYLLLTNI